MSKTLNVHNIDYGDPCLNAVDGISWPDLRERARKEGADSALVYVDGEPIIIRFKEPSRDRPTDG